MIIYKYVLHLFTKTRGSPTSFADAWMGRFRRGLTKPWLLTN